MASSLPTPTLETERFTLRPIERGDALAIYPTLSSDEHCRYMTRAAFATLDELEGWLFDPEWNGRTWAAIDRINGDVVARLVAIPFADDVSEIGYITVGHRHGEGIAGECAKRLVEHLFETEKHHRITAGTDPRNAASNALLTRLGFHREAHMRQSIKTHLGWCDEYLWGLLASDWQG
jgi:RimJ/RimL family protein N-acetyltransferase